MAEQGRMVGGLGDPKKADAEVQQLIEAVKPQVEKEVGRSLPTYTAKAYCTQLVNGINYFVKVDVGQDKCIHVRLHKAFSGEVTYSGCQDNMTNSDPLTYFQPQD